ncbi:hypothetical protein CRM22_002486 [Opisthorchis felineus]|uniref:Uncharacterized protein n=1 Tax=Opisthorchis felineus TaxID=147828 RepID=A0A4S2M647_OPIFE|nr:hypothetical protein CRM22_002486 [Opisthorchis felineus]
MNFSVGIDPSPTPIPLSNPDEDRPYSISPVKDARNPSRYSKKTHHKQHFKADKTVSPIQLVNDHDESGNNLSMYSSAYLARPQPPRLPPLTVSKQVTLVTDAYEVENVTCPTDYFKRLQSKPFQAPRNTKESAADDKCDTIVTTPPSVKSIYLKKTAKSNSCSRGRNKARNNANKSNDSGSQSVGTTKQRTSHVSKPADLGSSSQQTTGKEDTSVPGDKGSSENGRGSNRGGVREDLEEVSSRDRYLSVMEDLFKKHKGLSCRSNRAPQNFSNVNSSVVPGRRIQAIGTIPEDPMMKFTGRHAYHAMGFRGPDKSDSLIVEPDHDLIGEVQRLQRCERMLKENTQPGYLSTWRPQPALPRNLTRIMRERRQSALAFCQQQRLAPVSSVSERKSDMESVSSRDLTPMGSDEELWIDKNRYLLHFNPVVQICPNQSPWHDHSKKVDETTSETSVAADTIDAAGVIRRSVSADPLVKRKYSVDERMELRSAVKSILRNRSSMSSPSSDVYTSHSSSTGSRCGQRNCVQRRARSVSDLTIHMQPGDPFSFESSLGAVHETIVERNTGQDGTEQAVTSTVTRTLSLFKPITPLHDDELESGAFASSADRVQVSRIGSPSSAGCLDFVIASADPNPMAWFDLLDDKLSKSTLHATIREKLIAQFRLKGLSKLFMRFPSGMLGLQRELEKGWDIRPKPELLMKCVVKHHVLKMPITVQNSDLVEKIYMNSIVRHPVLYKLIMRRREILPQELQHFINRIMEMTETSDRMMATITNSTTKLAAVTTAAKEMDASGYMTGGPRVSKSAARERRSSASQATSRKSQNQEVRREQTGLGSLSDERDTIASHSREEKAAPKMSKKDAGYCAQYGKEIDFDKGFYTTLRNPCANILEEVALHLPEFAWHIRPLFEHLWATLEDELFERLIDRQMIIQQELEETSSALSHEEDEQVVVTREFLEENGLIPSRQDLLEWPETYELCVQLFKRIPVYSNICRVPKPGDGVLHDLLICLHMSLYYNKLGILLVKELDTWIPYLLNGLESTFSSVREETCGVLAYLVCAYRLMTKLHVTSKNLLVANITLSVLSAIGKYPETYAFYHGLLGYMLHSVPCLSTLDCFLLWLPVVDNDPNNLFSRDWPLFVYYVLRHWPRSPFYLDTLYQKKLLKPLETSFLIKHSRRAARLALSYLVRTCKIRSALLTCWPEGDEPT